MKKSTFSKYISKILWIGIVLWVITATVHTMTDAVSKRDLPSDDVAHLPSTPLPTNDEAPLLKAPKVPINLYINDDMFVGTNGWWSSPIYDLVKLANIPINSGTIPLYNFNFFYGDVTNVNNRDNDAYSIEQLSKFDIVVTHEPGENNTSRQQAVMKGLIQNGVKVFGYVQVGPLPGKKPPTFEVIKAAIDRCADFGYYGVFYDMFGYDYGITRVYQNKIINYTHSKNLISFVNAWIPADVLDSKVEVSHNPGGVATAMTTNDWVLLESFYLRSDSKYAGDPEGGFINSFGKYTDTVSLANPLGVNVCGLAYALPETSSTDITDWEKSYYLAVGLGLKGLSYSRSIENRTIEWPLEMLSPPKIGTSLVSAYKQIATDRYEAKTDAGIIQFMATDKPIKREAFSYQVPNLIIAELQTPKLAHKYNILYFSSSDGVTWRQHDRNYSSDRFFQVRIHSFKTSDINNGLPFKVASLGRILYLFIE